MRKWRNVELNRRQAEMLKCFLDEYDITYEASECYDDIHFEIACDEVERDAIEEFFVTELD
jgi:hypothetical protein